MLLGYARISTGEQSIDLQRDALTAAGCERIFADVASGSKTDRPGLARLLENARPGDTLVVWRLDRLGRSLMHLLTTVQDLQAQGIEFRSLTEAMDTSTNNGRLIFHIFSAIAEFERNLIRERVNAGLRAMRARGKASGRKTVMTPDKVRLMRELIDSGEYTRDQVATMLDVGRMTLFRALKTEANLKPG